MSRARWLVVLGFMLALAAGAVLGVAQDRVRHREGRESWLAAQLDLSQSQQEQIRQVWAEVMSGQGRSHRELRERLQQERDAAIRGLLDTEQSERYDAIIAEYDGKTAELKLQKDAAIQSAVQRTKQLLSPAQRQRYEELLLRRDQWPDRAGPGRRDPHGRKEGQGR